MTRVQWRLFTLAAAALTVASAWFALNGARIAKPGAGALSAVELPAEQAHLPPSDAGPPVAPAPLGKALFGPGGDPLTTSEIGARILRDLPGPTARIVLAPSPATPSLEDADLADARRALEPLLLAAEIAPPRHDQYFGASLLPDESRATDPDGPPKPGEETAAAAPAPTGADNATDQEAAANAPAFAPKPAPNPGPPAGGVAAPAPAPQIVVEPGETATAVAAAATSQAAPDPNADGPDGMILLGVFRGSGSSRALVRTATESARQVSPGDEINGWRVAAIGEDHIRLRRASQTRMLKLPGSQ